MNRKKIPARTLLAALMVASGTGRLLAQATPQPTPAPSAAPDEEVIELSPFAVTSSEDRGSYQAGATLAGSRIRTELRDVGSAISVVTSQFLQDTGAKNNETLLQYTVGTEVGGIGGNFAGLGDTQTLDDTAARLAPNANTRVRGLGAADNTRDFFLTDIAWDSFNTGRVDIQRGPNAILFGIGKPAGIINASLNEAAFKRSGSAELRLDNYGTVRGSLDYNHVLLKDELALRVAALDDYSKFKQKPSFNRDQRVYVAGRWDPKFIKIDGAKTTIKANFEKGDVIANRPRTLPPGDLITAWWTDPTLSALRQAGGMNIYTSTISDTATIERLRAAGDLGAGVRSDNSTYVNRAIGSFGRNYGGIVSVFDNPNSSTSHLMTTDLTKNVTSTITGLPWIIMSGVMSRSQVEAARKTLPNYDFYRDQSLQDPSIFDFYNNLIDGPNKREWSNHEAFNSSLIQTFFNDRLGFSAVADVQRYDRGQVNLLSNFGQAITLDMNNTLPNGEKNPNFGRAATISDQFSNNSYHSNRESLRATIFGELRGSDFFVADSLASRIIGKHRFTGLLSNEKYETESRSWTRYAADATYGLDVISSKLLRDRTVNTLNYLSGDLSKRSSLSGAGIGRIEAVQIPQGGNLQTFSTTWIATGVNPTDPWTNQYGAVVTQAANPANYRGWYNANGTPVTRGVNVISDEAGDRNALTTSASLTKSITGTYAANWQGFMFDGVFVPSVGIRVDRQKSYALNSGAAPRNADGSDTIDLDSPLYRLPDVADRVVKGKTKSWSLVLHTPKSISRKIWGNTGVSLFYNRSANFQPAAGRIDIEGNGLASPEGKTKDYGILISTLDDRLSLRITKYRTTVSNDRLDSFGGAYMTWGAEAWAYGFGKANQLRVAAGGWADFTKGYDPLGIVADTTPTAGWTPAQVTAAQAAGDAIVDAYMATRPSDAWYKLWGINTAAADRGEFIAGSEPSGFTVTGDTMSKGTEFELTAQVTPNWNIAVNAAKTEAQRTGMAASMVNWVEKRWAVYNTPVKYADGSPVMLNTPAADGGTRQAVIGDLRFWNGSYGPNETLRGKYLREFMSGYWLYRIQEGSNVPELRPWRFNVVTNYNFSQGVLKGTNVGGGVRWQDEVVIGYPVLPGATLEDARSFDLSKPYKGGAETAFDFWVGYQRKLTAKLDWRVQLNIRNVFAKNELIPITAQPDGSMAVGRIAEPRVITLTNTISF